MKKGRFIISLLIAAAVLVLGIGVGSVFVSPKEIFSVIGNKLFGTPAEEMTISLIWKLRLPRVIMSFLVGGALSAAGAVVQSVLKNPLASPYTLGVSSGASLGAAVVIITGFTFFGSFTLPFAGLAFGILTVVLAVALAARVDMNLGSSTIVLTGMVFSLFMNALVTLAAGLVPDKYPLIIQWQMGTFSAKGWDYIKIMLPVFLICMAVFLWYSKEMDLLTFGEEQASAVGMETKKVKWILLVTTAVLTGISVAFAGVIGFVDLIVPHAVRKIFSSKHKIVIPMSALLGGAFMTLCDMVARTIFSPKELSIGVVTAMVGAPCFVYIYLKGKKRRA